ncbi:MAG: TonB-dependent receptor, partial [Bdellovibrionales bacterium]|nr:TonB-dependent receptor [Bdellovibrionales bacterium]
MKPLSRVLVGGLVSSCVSLIFVSSLSAERATADSVLTNSNTLVVTAQREETAVDSVGSSITVITQEEIKRKHQPTVLELLRSVPGVSVIQNGGPGGTSSVFIRGAESDHTLVLIDGIRVNDSNSGQFSFADMKTENIERIEVLRGPQSVLYGSEAIGGVINVITKHAAEGVEAGVTLGGGSYSTQDYAAYARYGKEGFQSSNSIAFYDTNGFSVAQKKNGNYEKDGYSNLNFSSGNRFDFAQDGNLDLNFGYTNADKDLDDFDFALGAIDNLNATQDRELFTTSVSIAKSVNEWLTPTLELGFNHDQIEGKDPVVVFNNFDIVNQNSTATGELDIQASSETLATLGYSYEHRSGESKGNFDESRNVN